MIRIFIRGISANFFLFVAGCAVHPLPENAEGFNTVQIVERIRCEANKSLQQEVINLLQEQGNPLYDDLQHHPEMFQDKNLYKKLRSKEELYFYHRYINSGIALSFKFDITEENADNTEVDLLKAISGGTVGLNLKASSDRRRQNQRSLVVAETFGHLIADPNVCTPRAIEIERQRPFDPTNHDIPNLVYPITGSIGLFDVVRTFINLNEDGLLSKDATAKAPVLTDNLMFTTTFQGSVNPQVMLAQAGSKVDLKLATLTSQATRTDFNTVTIALSLNPESGYERAPFAGPFLFGTSAGAAVFARRTDDKAVQRALDAISQQRIDNFLDRFGQVPVQ